MNKSCCMIITTVPNISEAKALAKNTMKQRLAACVQVIPNLSSYYHWKGKLEVSEECQLHFKTLDVQADQLMEMIKTNHAYETPEIIKIGIDAIDPDYYEWVKSSV